MADKVDEFLCICLVAEEQGFALQGLLDERVELAELLGRVVRRCNVPVKVVLRKDVDNAFVAHEAYFLFVESTEIERRQVTVVGVGATDGQD